MKQKERPHRVCFDDKGLLSRAQFEETLLGSLGRNSGGRPYSSSCATRMLRAEIMPVRKIYSILFNFYIVALYLIISAHGKTGPDIVKNSDYC